ncbi:hypothetical protein [Lentzea sp. E54]|uniref:hypothetical protein n=1 Tax=Lentzea xerophila TaxID=3435883 RepID=UPI003DA51361
MTSFDQVLVNWPFEMGWPADYRRFWLQTICSAAAHTACSDAHGWASFTELLCQEAATAGLSSAVVAEFTGYLSDVYGEVVPEHDPGSEPHPEAAGPDPGVLPQLLGYLRDSMTLPHLLGMHEAYTASVDHGDDRPKAGAEQAWARLLEVDGRWDDTTHSWPQFRELFTRTAIALGVGDQARELTDQLHLLESDQERLAVLDHLRDTVTYRGTMSGIAAERIEQPGLHQINPQ